MKPDHDGVTRVLYRWIEALKRAGIAHLFVSPIVPTAADQITPMAAVPSVTFPLYKEYRLALPGSRQFEDRLRDFRPNLLHINSPCTLGFAALQYGRKHGIPVVATYHTHFANLADYYGVRALKRLSWTYFRNLYNGCERVFVPSQPILDDLRSHGFRTVTLLPHGVDASAFRPDLLDPDWRRRIGAGSRHVLLYVGRLAWEKDLDVLVRAYRAITAKRGDTLFVLAGDGPARDELTRRMPQALFLGHVTGHELSTVYASSDIFVFPSTIETFGNVTLEAMASGLPVVGARKGGTAGIIADGRTGFLAAPRDPEDFARRVEFLLDHPEQRRAMSTAAVAYARNHCWEPILADMFAAYHDILDGVTQPAEEIPRSAPSDRPSVPRPAYHGSPAEFPSITPGFAREVALLNDAGRK